MGQVGAPRRNPSICGTKGPVGNVEVVVVGAGSGASPGVVVDGAVGEIVVEGSVDKVALSGCGFRFVLTVVVVAEFGITVATGISPTTVVELEMISAGRVVTEAEAARNWTGVWLPPPFSLIPKATVATASSTPTMMAAFAIHADLDVLMSIMLARMWRGCSSERNTDDGPIRECCCW